MMRRAASLPACRPNPVQGGGRYPLAVRLPFFSLTWLFTAPLRLGCWAFFTAGTKGEK